MPTQSRGDQSPNGATVGDSWYQPSTGLWFTWNGASWTNPVVRSIQQAGGSIAVASDGTIALATTRLAMQDLSGNDIFTLLQTIPATPTASQNTAFIRNQFPSTMTALVDTYIFHVRGAGNGSSTLAGQSVVRVHFLDTADTPYSTNYTGSQLTAAGNFQSNSTGIGAHPLSGTSLSPSAPFASNCAVIAVTAGATAGWNIGTWGVSQKSTAMNIGAGGVAVGAAGSETVNIGVMGVAKLATGIGVSGYFYIPSSAAPPAEPVPQGSAAVYIDLGAANGTTPMLSGYSNNVLRYQVSQSGGVLITSTSSATGAVELSITPGAVTAATAEAFDVVMVTHTHTLAGTYATQRFVSFAAPTITAGSPFTVTTAATVAIGGAPIQSGSATLTTTLAFWVQAGLSAFGGAIIQGHATAAINATATATAAQVATGYITSTSNLATTITLPTGTNLGAALGAVQGTIFDLTIDNTAGSSTITVAVNTNAILSAGAVAVPGTFGLLTIGSGVTGQGTFRLMFSSPTAYTFSRVA